MESLLDQEPNEFFNKSGSLYVLSDDGKYFVTVYESDQPNCAFESKEKKRFVNSQNKFVITMKALRTHTHKTKSVLCCLTIPPNPTAFKQHSVHYNAFQLSLFHILRSLAMLPTLIFRIIWDAFSHQKKAVKSLQKKLTMKKFVFI